MTDGQDPTFGLIDNSPDQNRYDSIDGSELGAATLMLKEFPEGARVLDVGCGNGELSKVIKEKFGGAVVGVEANAYRAEIARSKGVEVLLCKFEDIRPEQVGQFDFIIFADVLEHLEGPGLALRKSRDLLKDNGRVVASIPNIAHWTIRLALLSGKFQYEPYGILDATHLRFFDRTGVERLFCKAGFQLEALSFTSALWLLGYQRKPWRWLPSQVRVPLVNQLTKIFPELFGCQFIVKARKI